MNRGFPSWGCPCRVPRSAEEGCESALAATEETPSALLWGGPQAGVVGAPTGRLDVALQEVKQSDSIAEPVAEAGVIVLLPLYLAAHGVDDLVKQHSAVGLEDLPLQAAAEDEDRCHRPALMEAKILCRQQGIRSTTRHSARHVRCTTSMDMHADSMAASCHSIHNAALPMSLHALLKAI